ncbi:hypothetical protein BFG52_11275 [Acinetobacter larvae]|uniref:Alpha/beta hydrolase n=2 Tax=Acinetobacter larvae TaxID=1789224 RepID=A0A1B2M121_9GAMM|nr:hypothetical protein BFG52_11275 [Acinetobacter larvae]
MSQQEHQAHSLKQHWRDIFQQGLQHSQSRYHAEDFEIEMAFYGDLITHYQSQRALALAEVQKKLPQPLVKLWQRANLANYYTRSAATTQIPLLPIYRPQQKASLKHQLWWRSLRFKDEIYKDLMIRLNRHPQLHLKVLQHFLTESYLYLCNDHFMQAVHQRLQQRFAHSSEPAIVVAHSLGTVIAYNFLRANPQFAVQRLITLASPLPYQAMKKSFKQRVARPTSLLGDWYNFCADEDFFATQPLDRAPFNFQPQIINQTIHTFVDKPHEIIGYLQHPQVIRAITLE